MISIIVAVSKNGVIGVNGRLPWRLGTDLERFKKLTMMHPVIMGRKTWDSIFSPLEYRKKIILTRDTSYKFKGCFIANTITDALRFASTNNEVFVIGGGEIYGLFLPITDKMYITEVNVELEGDTYFPKFNPVDWSLKSIKKFPISRKDEFEYTYKVLERRRK